MKSFKNLILRGGLTKNEFSKVEKDACEDNRKLGSIISAVGTLFFAIIILFDKLNDDVDFIHHIIPAVIAALIFILFLTFTKKYKRLSNVLSILYLILLLVFAIDMAFLQCNERTTLLLPFYIFASLMYTLRPIYSISIILISQISFIVGAVQLQSGINLQTNLINTTTFALMGILITFYVTSVKYKKLYAEYNSRILSEKDELTSLYNRRNLKEKIREIHSASKIRSVFAFDVNGLKEVNDNLGHFAGDELIVGAAQCINKVFSPYGEVFRTGGDEFIATIFKDAPTNEQLVKQLKLETSRWKGKQVDKLTIAVGYEIVNDETEEAINIAIDSADKFLYKDKQSYYNDKKIAD